MYRRLMIFLFCTIGISVISINAAEVITLDDALNIAIGHSSRGEIIKGSLEVAEKQYFAKKVNFYVPKVMLNSSLPSYSVNESFRFFGGATQKSLFKTTDFDFRSNIQLNQSLITGGDLSVTANLNRSDAKYPNTALGQEISELSQLGFFDFNFVQPLLQPSTPKFDLNNSRDDLEIARLTQLEAIGSLKSEVTESYMGVLVTTLQKEIVADKIESAYLKAGIDSLKLIDGVISEEDWLETSSAFLDAELEQFEITNQYDEKIRELTNLLDLDSDKEFKAEIPVVPSVLTTSEKKKAVENWEHSASLKRAKYQYEKEKRAADFQAGSHGLTGNLTANYSLGRGKVKTDSRPDDDIETNSWGLSINLTYPLWDGGASKAAVNAAYLSAEKSRLEYDSKRKSSQAEIINLINRIDVSHRKLEVLNKQTDLARNRLKIAQFRMDDGQISKTEYLSSHIGHLEARIKYIEELKKNIIDRITLMSQYRS